MILKELKEKVKSNQIEEAVKLIKQLKKEDEEVIKYLISLIKSTEDSQLRNMGAIALADMNVTEAVDTIILLLKDEKTINNRGTLVYALQSFDCSEHIEFITKLFIEDNYEVSQESLSIMKSNELSITRKQKRACLNEIKNKIEFLIEGLNTIKNVEPID